MLTRETNNSVKIVTCLPFEKMSTGSKFGCFFFFCFLFFFKVDPFSEAPFHRGLNVQESNTKLSSL